MLQGKKVVVTGGATGIGLGIALRMAEYGATVALGGRRPDAIDAALAQFPTKHPGIGRTLNVAVREDVDSYFQWATEQLGQIDILVQAAGINIRDRSIKAMKPEEWDEVLAINATGAYNCLHAVLPQMLQRKDGLIVNISSVAGKRAIALGGVAYGASKFAMTALGTCVSNEVAEDGIRVTNVYPGEVNTPILDKRPVPVSDEHRAKILQPEDVADIVVAIAMLPPRAHVPEVVIKPTTQIWY